MVSISIVPDSSPVSHRHYPREPNKTNGCSFLHERGGNVSAFACRIMNYRFSNAIRKRILYIPFA